jgi:hypothetical protein
MRDVIAKPQGGLLPTSSATYKPGAMRRGYRIIAGSKPATVKVSL